MSQVRRLRLGDADLAITEWNSESVRRPSIVFLHDGLGSIAQWRSIPGAVADRTGNRVIAYDRPGHGSSTPIPNGPWPTDWLHQESDRLCQLVDALGCERPLLVGHSDGGSIALIAAMDGLAVSGVVALAAHSWVEPVCRSAIETMRNDPQAIVAGLARYHDDAKAIFDAWSRVWVSEPFGRWDIRPGLGSIDTPVLVAQGDRDEYATSAMVTETVAAVGPNARAHLIPGGTHNLHHRMPDAVIALVHDAIDLETKGAGQWHE